MGPVQAPGAGVPPALLDVLRGDVAAPELLYPVFAQHAPAHMRQTLSNRYIHILSRESFIKLVFLIGFLFYPNNSIECFLKLRFFAGMG